MNAEIREYTLSPNVVRIYNENGEWFVDGTDGEGDFTETCWSFDTLAEAEASVEDFIAATTREGVVWNFSDFEGSPCQVVLTLKTT